MKTVKHELQNIISGKSGNSPRSLIASIANYLTASKGSSATLKTQQSIKEQEEEKLIPYINQHKLWYPQLLNDELKIGEGAEQIVYYTDDGQCVIKLNAAGFYLSWIDYLNNLLLHNFFFPDTSYQLVGFKKVEDILFAIVKQPFVVANQSYDFEIIKKFLEFNGFENNRNYDFINKTIGIILEDLHDENVLFYNNIPYFIDTVFYLTPQFYNLLVDH